MSHSPASSPIHPRRDAMPIRMMIEAHPKAAQICVTVKVPFLFVKCI